MSEDHRMGTKPTKLLWAVLVDTGTTERDANCLTPFGWNGWFAREEAAEAVAARLSANLSADHNVFVIKCTSRFKGMRPRT